ncbi:DUF3168 domain-containing protein [Pseudoruegeria sp. SK021]|uniref:DUF3168 domain-containing protein n=1 Tax=Pseudoruegeria sp. SK021 TaxID=1933035 RepID=UPI000A2388B9|nr:DUF3168 domain-containing protein [Pseudoruegeria sp. SK021]OSP54343.1 hypothetical protein BV911_13310 [Pseudoruegeria sp. SK021]
MTYVLASCLQEAVFARLTGDTALAGLVGTAIFDAAPQGQLPSIYVAIGPEDVVARSDKTGRTAQHRFVVSIVTDEAGFQAAKRVAAVVDTALTTARLPMARGTVVSLSFYKAKARRERAGTRRRIDLQFQALVDDA